MTPSRTATVDPLCNRAAFVGDVTIPDNTHLQLSQPFTKTWRIRNTGHCTWTTGYSLVFIGGDQMSAPASVPLPVNVAPQQTVDLSADMIAPKALGDYRGIWKLQAADGRIFGVGDTGQENMWARIVAVPPAYSTPTVPSAVTPTITVTAAASLTATVELTPTLAAQFNLASSPCDAQWQSNIGVLACPGKEGDAKGFVLRLENAQLEDGTTASLPSLLTFPHDSADGYILGVYPEYSVQPGDHFQASVGCEKNAAACSALFRLSYLDTASTPHDLWTLGEFYDGKSFNLNLDLSQLAGQKVKLVLSVSSLGDAKGDRALWVDPRIVRLAVPTATVTDTPTALPSSTVAPSPTTAPTLTATAAPLPTPVPTPAPQLSPVQQVFDSVINFFQRLFAPQP
ncbi:MAG TPA: NBR1-Ig-like domain-containing protein [Anaerolineales bacterium]|nr:NBR1-Ig-like domain-containing protein [Anaerolineales bacterium]